MCSFAMLCGYYPGGREEAEAEAAEKDRRSGEIGSWGGLYLICFLLAYYFIYKAAGLVIQWYLTCLYIYLLFGIYIALEKVELTTYLSL